MSTPLSRRLRQAKDELGYSVREIARRAELGGHSISVYTVTVCTNGKHGDVTPRTLKSLSYVLQVPYQELAELARQTPQFGHFRLEGQVAEHAESLTRAQADVVKEMMRLFALVNRKEVVA